jgi:hypothetical protein
LKLRIRLVPVPSFKIHAYRHDNKLVVLVPYGYTTKKEGKDDFEVFIASHDLLWPFTLLHELTHILFYLLKMPERIHTDFDHVSQGTNYLT